MVPLALELLKNDSRTNDTGAVWSYLYIHVYIDF